MCNVCSASKSHSPPPLIYPYSPWDTPQGFIVSMYLLYFPPFLASLLSVVFLLLLLILLLVLYSFFSVPLLPLMSPLVHITWSQLGMHWHHFFTFLVPADQYRQVPMLVRYWLQFAIIANSSHITGGWLEFRVLPYSRHQDSRWTDGQVSRGVKIPELYSLDNLRCTTKIR